MNRSLIIDSGVSSLGLGDVGDGVGVSTLGPGLGIEGVCLPDPLFVGDSVGVSS